ncbi:unnamed protein product [marine sediment metagenome]|uniref:Uncharacterized protein n=1 Tax=marine sediment metagenome TaxID=412755 RepID=X1QGE1_9ZZZZ
MSIKGDSSYWTGIHALTAPNALRGIILDYSPLILRKSVGRANRNAGSICALLAQNWNEVPAVIVSPNPYS